MHLAQVEAEKTARTQAALEEERQRRAQVEEDAAELALILAEIHEVEAQLDVASLDERRELEREIEGLLADLSTLAVKPKWTDSEKEYWRSLFFTDVPLEVTEEWLNEARRRLFERYPEAEEAAWNLPLRFKGKRPTLLLSPLPIEMIESGRAAERLTQDQRGLLDRARGYRRGPLPNAGFDAEA